MRFRVLALALFLAFMPRPAFAWDDLGHMVVTRIAWSQLSPRTRERIIELLRQAPADAGLADLRPAAESADRDPLFAERASTWPDIIRARDPAARHVYHRGPWHYIDWYWSADATGAPALLAFPQPDSVNIVVELERQSAIVRDTAAPAADRAVALAWVLHLAGDVHQPLHASSRVTPELPEGDRGGNLFPLEPKMSLHWYWDRVLTARYPRENGESEDALVARVAAAVEARAPRETLAPRIAGTGFDRWARESLDLAEHDVYCCGVVAGAAAPPEYLAHADAVSEPAIALAGYRLAALLERLLGP
jgi:hypothetical protein